MSEEFCKKINSHEKIKHQLLLQKIVTDVKIYRSGLLLGFKKKNRKNSFFLNGRNKAKIHTIILTNQ